MSAQILPFPDAKAPTQAIAHFIRVGDTGHRLLADLHAAGRLPARRVVFDASRIKHQKELVDAFRAAGAEIVLDTKAAELSAPARFDGFAKGAPWSAFGKGLPLDPGHFDQGASTDIIGQIARFAVVNRVNVVLAPSHFLSQAVRNSWLVVDQRSCVALRAALDREGGASIAIDYPLIIPHTALNDDAIRSELVSSLADLPFDNLWIRASGFGADAAPLTTKRYITALSAVHNLGKPVVVDYLGGLVGLSALAFGCASGLAHGVRERERFDAREWHKSFARGDDERGGRARRVTIASLDRSATISELELLAKAKGGRRLVSCGNRECCPHGLKDMIENPRRHAAHQRFEQVRDLEMTPDLNREQHFLGGQLTQADRLARLVKDLKIPEEEALSRGINAQEFSKRLLAHGERMDKMRSTLEHLHEGRGEAVPRARAVTRPMPVSSRAGTSGR